MGSNRSRKAKAREFFNDNLDSIFAQLAAERVKTTVRPENLKPKKEKESEKKSENEKENPHHPCYKCIGCIHWTKCSGYYQLLECIEQRKKAYQRKLAGE